MDLHLGGDLYDSFVKYQTALLAEFDKDAGKLRVGIIDASGSIEQVFEELRKRVIQVIA